MAFLGWKDIHIYMHTHSWERIVHCGALMLVVVMLVAEENESIKALSGE